MIANEIDIATTGGVMNTFIIHRDENGQRPRRAPEKSWYKL